MTQSISMDPKNSFIMRLQRQEKSVETELDVSYYLDSENHNIGFHQTVCIFKLICVFVECIWHKYLFSCPSSFLLMFIKLNCTKDI